MCRKPKTYTGAHGLTVDDLLHYGFDHISAAQTLLRSNACHYDSAGYVAHFGFELLLKAWHLYSFGSFFGTHHLKTLWNGLAAESNILPLSSHESETVRILDSYEKLRYPDLNNPVEIGSDDLPRINSLAGAIWERMPTPLRETIKTLHWSTKGGRALMEKPIPGTPKIGT